jgi:hypothetical protein
LRVAVSTDTPAAQQSFTPRARADWRAEGSPDSSKSLATFAQIKVAQTAANFAGTASRALTFGLMDEFLKMTG